MLNYVWLTLVALAVTMAANADAGSAGEREALASTPAGASDPGFTFPLICFPSR